MGDNYIHNGIPLRVGATRCELGILRGSPESSESSETNNDFSDITGCAPRDPKHNVQYETNAEGHSKVTTMTPWSSYPAELPLSTTNPDTHLVIKARGEFSGEFPKITLTLRPLKSSLDYKWTRDFTDQQPVGAINWFGAEGESTTYAENSDGEMVLNDFVINYNYYGEVTPDRSVEVIDGECVESPTWHAGFEAAANNEKVAQAAFSEFGCPMYLKGDFYWSQNDKPAGVPSHYAPPLQSYELDPTLYPRADGEEAYEFKKNETWDLRYRFPLWWNIRGGFCFWDETNLNFGYTPPTDLPSSNPFDTLDLFGGLPQRLCPVAKFLRVRDPSAFPVLVGSSEKEQYWKIRNLFEQKQVESVTKIRKRYPYSFQASVLTSQREQVYVIDWEPANRAEYCVGIQPPYIGESVLFDYYYTWFNAERPSLGIEEISPRYECRAWWRMEVELDRCEWNFDEELEDGWTIKGFIHFGKKVGIGAVSGAFNYYQGTVFSGQNQYPPFGYSPWGFYLRNGIWRNQVFGFGNTNPDAYDPAGSVQFEVKVTKDNALGKKVVVVDFPIGGQVIAPWNGQLTQFGDQAENSINFISDFYITEIIPPEPPE